MTEFKIGDKVVHPLYGVGTLVSIEKQGSVGMAAKSYVIELAHGEGRLITPVEKAESLGLRKAVSKRGRRKLWKVFSGRPRRLAENPLKRQSDIARRLREGNFVEVGRVIRDLTWRQGRGRATRGDKRLLQRAKELLAEELAVSDGIEVDEAMERIGSALKQRLSGQEGESN